MRCWPCATCRARRAGALAVGRDGRSAVGARAGAGGRGWPPYARGKSVLECVHVVLDEEWAHHGFCVRDLDLLGR